MSESTRTSRAPAEKRLTYQQWKRRKMLRLARNWVLFLTGCAAVVALLTGGILWLLPKVHGLLAGPKVFAASVYDGTDYVFNAADARLVLVNANLPYTAEPAPLLDTADEVTGQQLEAEAAMQYRSMAAAAQADGVSLTLVAGYQDADTRQAAYEARVQTYRDKRKSEEEAARLAATIQPAANANEHGTGYAADILSADNPQQDTGFAETRAYEWLTAYAAEYGFILRYPQDRQAATGIVFEPWHWRYVGGGKRPCHPRQRPEPGRVHRPAEGRLNQMLCAAAQREGNYHWNVLSLHRACIFPATRLLNSTAAASASTLLFRPSVKRPLPMRCCRW